MAEAVDQTRTNVVDFGYEEGSPGAAAVAVGSPGRTLLEHGCPFWFPFAT